MFTSDPKPPAYLDYLFISCLELLYALTLVQH